MLTENLTSLQSVYTKWSSLAADAPESQSAVPIIVLLGEALDLAETVERRWEPATGKKPLPGLKEAVAAGYIPETLAADLRELAGAVTHAHGEYRGVNGSELEAPVERGEFLLAEMRQCLEFIFDDGVVDANDAALARLTESHNDTSSHDALAMSLEGFALFANNHRDKLATLPEFELAMLDEAIAVAARLRQQSAMKLSGVTADRQRQVLSERNRLMTLLLDRMSKARRAFRFVFRNYPDISKLAGSVYQRNRRAAARAIERDEAEAAGTTAPVGPATPVAPATPIAPSPLTGPSLDMEGAMGSPFTA